MKALKIGERRERTKISMTKASVGTSIKKIVKKTGPIDDLTTCQNMYP